MTPDLDAPDDAARFTIALALRLHVLIGPMEVLGPCHDGFRENYPIVGGHFAGPRIRGEVLPSGADISVLRSDGVCEIDALYRIRADDGAVIIVHNRGLWRDPARSPTGRGYLRTTPRFIAPQGPHAWLNESLFVGTVDDLVPGELMISCYLLGGD